MEIDIREWQFQAAAEAGREPAAKEWVTVRIPFAWTQWWTVPAEAEATSWGKGRRKLRARDSAWFESKCDIPAAWSAQRIWLCLDGIECDALVWVDGQSLGLVDGPEGRVDITEHVTAGRPAAIRLWVTRWWEGIPKKREDDPLRDAALRSCVKTQWYKGNEDKLRQAIPGGLSGHIRLEARPLPAEVTDVFVKTSVRRKLLTAEVETLLSVPLAGGKLRLRVREDGGAKPPVSRPSAEAPLAHTTPGRHLETVEMNWQAPRLWELWDAHLYRLEVELLDGSGKVIQSYRPVRFGFREIWAERNVLVLNGHPCRLRLGANYGIRWPSVMFLEGIGFNAAEQQPNGSSWFAHWGSRPQLAEPGDGVITGSSVSTDGLRLADERGWAVLMPAPLLYYIRDGVVKPDATELYRRQARLWMRRLRNHPSIFMWIPNMNTAANYHPERIGRHPQKPGAQARWYGHVQKLIKEVDPTRLVFIHSGGQSCGVETNNLYLNFMALQEREEFPSAWSKAGEKPWGVVEHGPPYVGCFYKRRTPLFTEYFAMYLGDRAYRMETDDYVRLCEESLKRPWRGHRSFTTLELARLGEMSAFYEFMDLFIRNTNRAWRGWGVNIGWYPWLSMVGYGVPPKLPKKFRGFTYAELTEEQARASHTTPPTWANPLYHAYRDTMQPLLVYIGGPSGRFTAKDHAFFAGEEFQKTIVAVWDGPGRASFDAHWRLETEGKVVASGIESFDLSPGAIERRPIRLTAPGVKQRTDAALHLRVSGIDTKAPSTDAFQITLWPSPDLSPRPVKGKWGVFDPRGESEPWLRQLGLKPRPVRERRSLPEQGIDVLVIGRDALADTGTLPFTTEDLELGLRVLVLEQNVDALASLGLRAQDVAPRYVFIRDGNHGVLSGLEPEDLCNWRGEGTHLPRTSAGMKQWPHPHAPHWGNYGSVASVVIETPHRGSFTPILECEFDLAYSPLLEWRQGAGGIVFCQLDLTGRVGLDPAATALARNLVACLDEPFGQTQNRKVVYAGSEEGWRLVASLGMATVRLAAGEMSELSPDGDVLVVAPGKEDDRDRHQSLAADFAQRGGSVLLLPGEPGNLGGPEVMQSVRLARAVVDEPAPRLLRGVGPHLLHWRSMIELNAFAKDGLPAGSQRYLNGLLMETRRGKGRVIHSQIDWRKLEDGSVHLERPRWNLRKFYRQLLTNLRARSADQPARRLATPRRCAPMVNIPYWRILNGVYPGGDSTPENTMPALAAVLPPEVKPTRRVPGPDGKQYTWTGWGPKNSGKVHLDWVSPTKVGKIGYATSYIYSSRERQATFAVSADYWFVFKVNGQAYVDHSAEPRGGGAPRAGEFRLCAPLKADWNRLEFKVASGSGGFGFWCMVSDPGDLRFSRGPSRPGHVPDDFTPAGKLLPEPEMEQRETFYTRSLGPGDDPYAFRPW